jgi:transposase
MDDAEWYIEQLQARLNRLRDTADDFLRQAEDLRRENRRLLAENARLQRRIEELTAAAAAAAAAASSSAPPMAPDGVPDFVKPSVTPKRRARRPGRKRGHPAALRPPPARVDADQDVPLPRDPASGRDCCPDCRCPLRDVRGHERVVEDLVPARVVVTCYHTRSGYCAACRRRVESRAPEQPPAADVPHGQLGLNALATAAVLRVAHRLPFRQVARVLADLPGLTVSAGGIARQLQRLGRWLAPCYDRVLLALRAAPRVHADETGWRTGGRNGFLWAVTGPAHTLYHVDRSRAGRVIRDLLGAAFGGTLVSDFYAAYDRLDCRKQRCLVHLLRELREAAERHPAFAACAFRRRAARLVRDLLALKRRWGELDDRRYTARACRLEDRLDQLLRSAEAGGASPDRAGAAAGAGAGDEPNAARIARRMRRYRRELTTFLWDEHLDGTNNAAERALRPAVVARKISGGSRSPAGAEAWARLASLMRTAGQQGHNVLDVIRHLLVEHWAGRTPMALTSGP